MDPNCADALHLMGLLSIHTQQYDHAVAWVSRAVQLIPKLEYLVTLGTVLRFQRRPQEAFEAFDKAAQLSRMLSSYGEAVATSFWSSSGRPKRC